jgi:serine/threonine-protein phosphatase 2A regulatory subunit B
MSSSAASSLYDESLDDDDLREGMLASRSQNAAAAGPQQSHPVHYAFAQAFGEKGADCSVVAPVQDADMISAVRFAGDGELIATGDKGGRIVILKRVRDDDGDRAGARQSGMNGNGYHGPNANERGADRNIVAESPNFAFWTQFQSHEPEFDYLKSMEIEEKINQIRWCRRINGDHRLIATNDKTIKIWRVFEKDVTAVATLSAAPLRQNGSVPKRIRSGLKSNPTARIPVPAKPTSLSASLSTPSPHSSIASASDARSAACASISLPVLEHRGTVIQASPRRVFSNAHAYHINSISLNSDEETFLSADDLRVNMWNLNVGGDGFNILDIKPENMEDLTEVITAAEFHPQHCHLFMHSTSRGVVKLCDLRQAALCKTWSKEYDLTEDPSARNSFFSEIIASISDVKFSPDGRHILTRDYMHLRLWDINMEREPVLVVPVHEHLRARLGDLYENDCIFDKFQCAFSHDGGSVLTGSYNSLFQSYSAASGDAAAVEASVDFVSGASGRHHFSPEELSANLISCSTSTELVDPSRRILHLDASPVAHMSAVAAGPALYVYTAAARSQSQIP